MGTWVIKVTELNFEVRSDLRGHLEAAVTLEAMTRNVYRQYAHGYQGI